MKTRKKNSLLKTTVIVSALVVLGKALGFGREALIAAFYGATAQTDAFFFAQDIHNMLFPAVSGSLAEAFTAVYVNIFTKHGDREGDRFGSRAVNAALLMGLLLGLIGTLVAPVIVPLLAPGFKGETLNLAIRFTRINMGFFFITTVRYLLSSVLTSRERFIGSQVAGLTFNITIILAVLLFAGSSLYLLNASAIVGGAVQLIMLGLFCIGCFRYTPKSSPFHPDVRYLFTLAMPIFLGNSVWQLNNIVDKALSSTLTGGSLSALTYGGSLNGLVVNVFITSLSTVLYPTLTAAAASGDREQFSRHLLSSLQILSMILMPICCVTLFTSREIVQIVFGHGSFDRAAVGLTAVVLVSYVPRFLFIGIREVLTRGFFANQNMKTPALNSAIGVGCNICFSLLLVRRLGLMGIALGTSVADLVSAGLLFIQAGKRLEGVRTVHFLKQLAAQIAAGILACIALYLLAKSRIPGRIGIGENSTFLAAMAWFLLCTLIGFLVYIAGLFLIDRSQLQRRGKK